MKAVHKYRILIKGMTGIDPIAFISAPEGKDVYHFVDESARGELAAGKFLADLHSRLQEGEYPAWFTSMEASS